MADWTWISENVVLAIHEEQIDEHGGRLGIRDTGLLDSALARPRNLAAYAPAGEPDPAALAAAYAFGVTRNHPFVDGNKRTGFVLLELFLRLNGFELAVDDEQCVTRMLELAAGTLTEQDLAAWVRAHIVPSR